MNHSPPALQGYLLLVLHSHLPFIRYPESDHHLEENWLYEAITETYIPLLTVIENLLNDTIDFRMSFSLTPSLLEMLDDDLLQQRYMRHIDMLVELSEKEIFRTRDDIRFGHLARLYHEKYRDIRRRYADVYRKDLIAAFRSLLPSGKIELLTSAATHAYLPALMSVPEAVRAQLRIGSRHFSRKFGKDAQGIWLPECGFVPGLDSLARESGFNYFFLESHGVLNSTPRTKSSIYAPIKTPSGVAAFARDVDSSKQVWSAAEGYPGDFDYRDFYRDLGFDLDYEYIEPYLPGGTRTFTGMKYYAITGKSDLKKPYIRERALAKAKLHAEHFILSRMKQVKELREKLSIKPLVTACYDAELFGHWWFEGPEWLDFMLRSGSMKQKTFRFTTPAEFLADNPRMETATPAASSWGFEGYSSTWIDRSNSWIYRHLHRAAKKMSDIAGRHERATGLLKRALRQAARELLLAQSSDWAFMMKTGNASEFAENKFREHIKNFFSLSSQITSHSINRRELSELEQKNSLFSDIDYRVFVRD